MLITSQYLYWKIHIFRYSSDATLFNEFTNWKLQLFQLLNANVLLLSADFSRFYKFYSVVVSVERNLFQPQFWNLESWTHINILQSLYYHQIFRNKRFVSPKRKIKPDPGNLSNIIYKFWRPFNLQTWVKQSHVHLTTILSLERTVVS